MLLYVKCGLMIGSETSVHAYRAEAARAEERRPSPEQTRETLNQCCFDVGPASQTLAQHRNSIGSESRVCRDRIGERGEKTKRGLWPKLCSLECFVVHTRCWILYIEYSIKCCFQLGEVSIVIRIFGVRR